jgi:hypothetical protein
MQLRYATLVIYIIFFKRSLRWDKNITVIIFGMIWGCDCGGGVLGLAQRLQDFVGWVMVVVFYL